MIWSIPFIGLVVFDGFLTQKLLELGAREVNPSPIVLWTVENLWARTLVAIAIVVVIRLFRDENILIPLTFIFLGICIYNGLNLVTSHAALFGIALVGMAP